MILRSNVSFYVSRCRLKVVTWAVSRFTFVFLRKQVQVLQSLRVRSANFHQNFYKKLIDVHREVQSL